MKRLLATVLIWPLAGLGQAASSGMAITVATVHTVSDAGTLENAVVLVKDGRIQAVAPGLSIPDGYQLVDAVGKVLTPGLVESYSQLGIVEIGMESSTVDAVIEEYPAGAAFDVCYALNPASVALAVNRRDGIARAIVAPAAGNDPFAGRGVAIRLGGEPMLVRPEVALFASIGSNSAGFVGGSRSAVIQRMRRGFEQAERYNPARYNPGPGDFSHQDMAALKAYLAGDAPLAVTVHRANEIREAVALAKDFNRRLIVLGGTEAWKVADLLAREQVPVMVAVRDNVPRSYDRLGARLDNAALLEKAGVTVLLTGGQSQNARWIRQMAGNAVAYGMPWEAALAAMTRSPARVWGLPGGIIAAGEPADLVIWSGDPLEITEWAERVMIDGEWQDMTTRQTRLFDRYRGLDRPDFYYR